MKEQKIKEMVRLIDPSNFREQIEAITAEIDRMNPTKIKEPTDMATTYLRELEARKIAQPLKWGIPSLDYFTGGLRKKELTVIAARPSIGKTALALQVAANIAVKGHKVLFFPLEMSGSQLMERIACRETEIRHETLKSPKNMTKEEQQQLKDFIELYKVTYKDLTIIEGVARLADIKKHIEHYQPKVVFIDQLSQLRENRKFNSIREQFTYMTNSLKAMTMELDIPIVLLAQINRDAQNTEPNLAQLKESGSIEEDSDAVIMLHQTGESTWNNTPTEIIIRKQRNGERDRKIETMYLNKKFIFREVEKLGKEDK
jgi:replicative DNA helicase